MSIQAINKNYSRPKDDTYESFKVWYEGLRKMLCVDSAAPANEDKIRTLWKKYAIKRKEFDAAHPVTE